MCNGIVTYRMLYARQQESGNYRYPLIIAACMEQLIVKRKHRIAKQIDQANTMTGET